MNKEELEILLNKMYYDYVDREEAQKIIDYIKNLEKENQELKKQLDYLRSGEYYNQLRFENEMLQQVVDTNGVPSEVYDYIDCTHRNTELLEENQKYKEVIDKAIEYIEGHKCVIKHYEPYGTPTGLPNYETCDIKGYYKLLDILKGVK